MIETQTTCPEVNLSSGTLYRYKLNYLDFLKMSVSDLFRLERYLFYQLEPLEIEVYLEEILMSVNHNDFQLGMTEFAKEYYSVTERLVTSLVLEDVEEGREFFKVQLNEDRRYVVGLIESYIALMKICRNIQFKLLSKLSRNYKPITIVCSSYILNRLATVYTDQYANRKISMDKVREPWALDEAQVRDLHMDMKCLLPRKDHRKLLTHFNSKWNRDKLRELLDSSQGVQTLQNERFVDALQILELYDHVTQQPYHDELTKWLNGGIARIELPYFNSPVRGITSDWGYQRVNFPKELVVY